MSIAQEIQETHKDTQEQDKTIENRVAEILTSYKGNKDNLIPILQRVQQEFGYLPEQSMSQIASFVGVPECTVFGIATFYAQFKLVPTGRNIVRVCRGTACHVKGGARILREVERQLGIKPGESTPDLEYGLETVACIGACALAPTMVVNDDTHGQMTTKKVSETFKRND
ncbi:NADH-quinone oxidoreductase subunit NuoE [Chloroflexota bacterium]